MDVRLVLRLFFFYLISALKRIFCDVGLRVGMVSVRERISDAI